MASIDFQGKIVPYRASKSKTNTDIRGWNESVRSGQHLILKLLLIIAAFIWQALIGYYGNGLTDVEEKPKILGRIWQRTSRVIRNSFHMGMYDTFITHRLKWFCPDPVCLLPEKITEEN